MKKVLELLALSVVAASFSVGCLSDDKYTVVLPDGVAVEADDSLTVEPPYEPPTIEPPPLVEVPPIVPPTIIPPVIREQFEKDMPVYSGVNPPDISGQYLVSPHTLVGSTDGSFPIGYKFVDMYIAFIKRAGGKLSYRSKESNSISGSDSIVVQVVGEGNDFTAYFESVGESHGIYTRMSEIISGKLTSNGISDYHNAFIMLEKGPDPSNILVEVNTYRVFKDNDGLASNSHWYND